MKSAIRLLRRPFRIQKYVVIAYKLASSGTLGSQLVFSWQDTRYEGFLPTAIELKATDVQANGRRGCAAFWQPGRAGGVQGPVEKGKEHPIPLLISQEHVASVLR